MQTIPSGNRYVQALLLNMIYFGIGNYIIKLYLWRNIIIVLVFTYDEKELNVHFLSEILVIYAIWKRKDGIIGHRKIQCIMEFNTTVSCSIDNPLEVDCEDNSIRRNTDNRNTCSELLLMIFTTWSYSINRNMFVNSGILNFKWEDFQLWIFFSNVTFGLHSHQRLNYFISFTTWSHIKEHNKWIINSRILYLSGRIVVLHQHIFTVYFGHSYLR